MRLLTWRIPKTKQHSLVNTEHFRAHPCHATRYINRRTLPVQFTYQVPCTQTLALQETQSCLLTKPRENQKVRQEPLKFLEFAFSSIYGLNLRDLCTKALLLLTTPHPEKLLWKRQRTRIQTVCVCVCVCACTCVRACVTLQRMKKECGRIILCHPERATVKAVPTASRPFVVNSGMIPTTATEF